MIRLIHGEIYRLARKRSMYIYFAALALAYFFIAFVRSGGFGDESIGDDAALFFSFSPALAGGFIFAAVYTDDLHAKNLIALVGQGLGKTAIVLAKFILVILTAAAFFALLPLFHVAVYAVCGQMAVPGQLAVLYAISLKFLLMTMAYCALSAIAVFGLQRATFAMVAYVLFAFGVVATILTAAGHVLGLGLHGHLLSSVTDGILAAVIGPAPIALPLVQYGAYVAVALLFSAITFNKKEMEF